MKTPTSTPLALCLALALAACGDEPARQPPDTADAPDLVEGDTSDVGSDVSEPVDLSEPVPAGAVVAGVATSRADLLAGPKAEGLPGDLVLRNARAAFVIEGARAAGGYRQWGGHLVDAALIEDGVTAPDRFGELWLAWNLLVFAPRSQEVVSDGRDGRAQVRLAGRTAPYPWADSFLRPILDPPPADLAVTYDYTLLPDEAALTLAITLTNDGDAPVSLDLPLVAMNMGDGPKGYAPGGGLGEVARTPTLAWVGAIGLEASYAFASRGEPLSGVFVYANMEIMQLPAFNLAPGASRRLEFTYAVSRDGTTGLDAARGEGVEVSGRVSGLAERHPGRGDAEGQGAWVAARGPGGEVLGLTPVSTDGSFTLRTPAGEVALQAWATGQGGSGALTLLAPAADVELALVEPAMLTVTISDEQGAPLPSQLTLFREEGTASPFAPPEIRLDRDWGGARSEVAYITAPSTIVRVPPGRYRAVASRGYSYELAEAPLDLEEGDERTLELTLVKAVDTTGWLAADLHLHGRWSSDSDVPYNARVRQAAANDVALPVLTEHAYVGDLLSAASIAGVDAWVTPIPAQEVTTFEYGHFNAFPLVYDPDAPSGGGVFEHGHPGAELFDAMRAQQPEEVLIQINHPRGAGAFGYFDRIGLDTETGVASNPERFTRGWELIEVFNGACVGERNARALADWIGLTNLGWRKTLSSGSDSHSLGSGIGHPRSWIALDQAALALDPQAIVAPLKSRRTFVSCGPFVRFTSSGGAQMGELTGVDGDGLARFAVTVEAPTWIGVREVRLWENGVPIATVTLEDAHRGPDAERPAVRFDGVLEGRPSADAWYAVEVLGEGSLSPVELGDTPYALTNPIEVDADGDGEWTPPGPPR